MATPLSLLNSTFQCSCGQTHTVPVKSVVYSEDACVQLPGIIREEIDGMSVTLLADERTMTIAGAEVEHILSSAGFSVKTCIVPDEPRGSPVCNDITVNKLRKTISPPDFFVAVGSGVINDLAKWLAFEQDRPYAVVATAASMNGYTAANVAPTISGVKSLIRARAPVAVLAKPSVILRAPFELTASGFGDLQAKCISVTDWKLNSIVFGDHFCPFCADIISEIEPLYADKPEGVKHRNPESIMAVFDALIYTGLAMTLIGTSSPASGGEHLFSHTLDMMSFIDGHPHDLHGRQVGLGTIIAAELYARLFALETPVVHSVPLEINTAFWGPVSDAVAEQYSAKLNKYYLLADVIQRHSGWQALRVELKPYTIPPAAVAGRLERAGAARKLSDIDCSRTRAKRALLHMHQIRSRCTIIDLAWLTGILPAAADDILDTWLT
jgi:glycerol-1-phosphate dehydrogenase [NAD(P)+]